MRRRRLNSEGYLAALYKTSRPSKRFSGYLARLHSGFSIDIGAENRGGGAEFAAGVPYITPSSPNGPLTSVLTYAAGYVLPGTDPSAGQTPLPSDLEQAGIEQVAFWFQNRTSWDWTQYGSTAASTKNSQNSTSFQASKPRSKNTKDGTYDPKHRNKASCPP